MTDEGKTRDQVHEFEVDAPPEAVWRALTTPEGITAWFTTKAEVEPGPGGKITCVWEEMDDAAGSGRIEAWEPGRRLLLRRLSDGEGPVIMEEYTIESLDGGRSRVRYVESGIPDDPAWDGYYDSTADGWRMYFGTLAHALARHEGRPRRAVTVLSNHEEARPETWSRVMDAIGLPATPAAGERVRIRTPEGGTDAEVLDALPEAILLLRLPDRQDRLLALLCHHGGEGSMYWGQIAGYGDDAPDAAAFEPWLRALPSGSAPAR